MSDRELIPIQIVENEKVVLCDKKKIGELILDRDIALAACKKLLEAVEFYGDNSSYRTKNGGHIENKNLKSGIGRDTGKRARQVLESDEVKAVESLISDKQRED